MTTSLETKATYQKGALLSGTELYPAANPISAYQHTSRFLTPIGLRSLNRQATCGIQAHLQRDNCGQYPLCCKLAASAKDESARLPFPAEPNGIVNWRDHTRYETETSRVIL